MHTVLLAQLPSHSDSRPAVVRSRMEPQTQRRDTRGRWACSRSSSLKAQLILFMYLMYSLVAGLSESKTTGVQAVAG